MENKYARVIIDISHEKVDRPFCYRVPELLQKEIKVGDKVVVPFGQGNTRRNGYVIELISEPDFEPSRIKELFKLKEGIQVEGKMICLAAWMKEQYGCTMIQALQTVLPAKAKIRAKEYKTLIRKADTEVIKDALEVCEKKKQPAKARALREFLEHESIPYSLLIQKLHLSSSTIQSLIKSGYVELVIDTAYRNPLKEIKQTEGYEEPPLSLEQQQAVDIIKNDWSGECRGKYLLHGITGSGKTRVYLELIEEVIARKESAIMLIPEISLTFQTVMRFQKRFGNRVSILNSALSAGERYDQCERAKKGEIDIIIGPRSALFTPFEKVGLIIIDEEHESSYKSESMPKYHAREVAEKIALIHGATLVLGSATPSVDSYYKAEQKEYRLLQLTKRLTGGQLPTVYVEDLRKELKKGNRSIFSERLQELIRDRLGKKEQIMLFLNRRGYSSFLSCRSCGEIIKCPHCDVSLTMHRNKEMVCHYCGYKVKEIKKCPHCNSPYISGFKAGTQKIEEEFIKTFGKTEILRMDKDTTGKKDSYDEILSRFMEEKAQVLIGTQMIVKGHDFPKVTLVGILAADISLGANDFRAGERTFQLLTQAAGRAGRGRLPGEVVIQSYQPEHYSIGWAAGQDYNSFYQEEILYRKLGGYPPVIQLMTVQLFGENKELLEGISNKMAKKIKSLREEKLVLLGPSDASIGRINDIYRMRIILKHEKKEILRKIKEQLETIVSEGDSMGVLVQFDFNPMSSF
ncbi:MAG: primosomal protein N' [Lachnospiraceae bacterium]|nr:primosomal protein N' [Lachnospiraceae bacterium]